MSYVHAACLVNNLCWFSHVQTPRRKSLAEEKPSNKDDSKILTPPRKSSASAPADDSDKVVNNKLSSPIRRTSGVLNNPNVTNLVKVAASNRKLTDASASWTTLPPSLVKLGKVFASWAPVLLLTFYAYTLPKKIMAVIIILEKKEGDDSISFHHMVGECFRLFIWCLSLMRCLLS